MRYCKNCCESKPASEFKSSTKLSNCIKCEAEIKRLPKNQGKRGVNSLSDQDTKLNQALRKKILAEGKKKISKIESIRKVEINRVSKIIGASVKVKATLIINNIPLQYIHEASNEKEAEKHIDFMYSKPNLVAENYLKELRG